MTKVIATTLVIAAVGITGATALATPVSAAATYVPPTTVYAPPPSPGTYTYAPPPGLDAAPVYSYSASLPHCQEKVAGVTIIRGGACRP